MTRRDMLYVKPGHATKVWTNVDISDIYPHYVRVTGPRYWWAWLWSPRVSLGETIVILLVISLIKAVWP